MYWIQLLLVRHLETRMTTSINSKTQKNHKKQMFSDNENIQNEREIYPIIHIKWYFFL